MFNFYNTHQNEQLNKEVQEQNVGDAGNNFATLQKVRKDLVGELDAIIQYEDHIQTSNNTLAVKTWEDIRNEELVHVGELCALMEYLSPNDKKYIDIGIREFNERLNNV